MSSQGSQAVELHDESPDLDEFRHHVLQGLARDRKRLSSKYLYDQRGSELFDRICEVDEYYPTRTELRITQDNAKEMAAMIGPRCLLIEFGSGSSVKTRILLDELEDAAAYVPVDISAEHLLTSAKDLANDYPGLRVLPVCADFTQPFDLPECPSDVGRRVVYFPGSTIGNFTPEQADKCLALAADLCGTGGGLLIGVDLKKDRETLEAAYNDAEGVTAEFNLNLLARINRELDADFSKDQFEHKAVYDEKNGRIESYLVSLCEQEVTVDETVVSFNEGESILTEYSHKYSLADFQVVASVAGFSVRKVWTDARSLFSVQYLTIS